MAEVRIEEVPVTRVFHEGKGLEVMESWKTREGEGSRRYACWFDAPHGLSVGDVVTVTGLLGVKVDEWTDKEQQVRHTAKVSLNGARIIGTVESAGEPAGDVWNTPGDYTDESPF